MKLCITEKPSVAKDIAAVLGASTRRDGFYEGSGYKVTWTFGHLCTLKEPADYTPLWKRWSLGALPMIPPRFGIKLIDDTGIKRQFDVIKSLIAEASEVINCGDAGQEGELIQRWVMQLAGVNCPVSRLWISSLTDEAIRRGFSELRPQSEFDNLYHAGLSRAIGDWLLGINATRLYTLKYSSAGHVLSLGRVQTPTLALVVKRHHEIASFKPSDYFEIKTVYRGVTFAASRGRFDSQEKARAVIDRIAPEPLVVTSVQRKKGSEAPERLFDLTSLQVECNKLWGWTAEHTLRLIQSLYEKKLTTYPRVDTTFLPLDLHPRIPEILKQMTPYASIVAPILASPITRSRKIFDDTRVTDHHAIIPTGVSPAAAAGPDERKLYHLIAMRFIAAFYPPCLFDTTTVTAVTAGVTFKASGKVITSPGWKALYKSSSTPAEEEGEGKDSSASSAPEKTLPPFTEGESGPHSPSIVKKTTTPPKLYTEGSLLRAMETAGNTVDDDTLRQALKENGIGRPSTRAAIIETLFKRGYISRQRKNIIATPAGISLIAAISQPLLKSAELTGIWENKLRRVERGDFDPATFLAELKEMVNGVVISVLSDNSTPRVITD